jgi:hypothetical protein
MTSSWRVSTAELEKNPSRRSVVEPTLRQSWGTIAGASASAPSPIPAPLAADEDLSLALEHKQKLLGAVEVSPDAAARVYLHVDRGGARGACPDVGRDLESRSEGCVFLARPSTSSSSFRLTGSIFREDRPSRAAASSSARCSSSTTSRDGRTSTTRRTDGSERRRLLPGRGMARARRAATRNGDLGSAPKLVQRLIYELDRVVEKLVLWR